MYLIRLARPRYSLNIYWVSFRPKLKIVILNQLIVGRPSRTVYFGKSKNIEISEIRLPT